MTDTTAPAPAPKKRSIFKRAAWQDSTKKEGEDIFSHSNEFKDIVAERTRRQEEDKRKEEERKKAQAAEKPERKRRRISKENDDSGLSKSEASGSTRESRTGSKARSRTPLSPVTSHPSQATQPAQDSLVARYDLLTNESPPQETTEQNKSVVIDLGSDSDDEDNPAANSKSYSSNASVLYRNTCEQSKHDIPGRICGRSDLDESDEEVQEVLDPTLAALKAKAREKAAEKARAESNASVEKAGIVELLVSPEIPDAKPLLVRVRIDSTIGRARKAWCALQKYDEELTKNVFFTYKGTRIYDSTTIKRLGIIVDAHGGLSVEGDTNIYDDNNVPKVVVEAWTEPLFQQRKREDAAEAAARRKAAEPSPEVEEREPTPPPIAKVSKTRLTLKARGREEFRIGVNPDTTFAHIASAYKTRLKIDKQQPVTLMFDGERLMPLDTVADTEIEDLDVLEVLFK